MEDKEIVLSDEDQIRGLKDEEEKGWNTGDVDLIVSCYAPNFIGYNAYGFSDPSRWEIVDLGPEAFRERLSRMNLQDQGWGEERREHVFEHLQIKGNAGVALVKHPAHHTLWTFKKVDGVWKIMSFIHNIGIGRGGHPSPSPVRKSPGLLGAALLFGGMIGLGVGYYLGTRSE